MFLPGESHGRRSLEGYGPWGRKNWTPFSDHTTTPGEGERGALRHILALICSGIHSLTRSFYTHGRLTATRLWLLPSGRPLQGDSLEVLRSWAHPPVWGARRPGQMDLPPGRWTWGPGGPAFPGLWGRPAVRPAGSRGQCPDANGGRSCGQAGAGLRCWLRRVRALRALSPEHPLMKPKLDVKWKKCFLPDMGVGLQPHLQTLRNEAVPFGMFPVSC